MNDFTKEELHGLMDSLIQSNWVYEDERKVLQEKIQSMIDNYCEHEFNYKDVGKVEICGKCEKIREFK